MPAIPLFQPLKTVLGLCLAVLLVIADIRPAYAEDTDTSDWHYTLRPRDTLQTLGNALLLPRYSWTDLASYNEISNVGKLAPGSIIRIPMQWLKYQPQPASVLSVQGTALIKRSGQASFTRLNANEQIHVGDEIATQKGSILIRFADASILRLEEQSNLVFNRLSSYGNTGMVDTRMRLNKGSISTDVTPLNKGSRFEISTPSAVAAVRGTEFRLESTPEDTKLEVVEGKVALSHEHGETVVPAGQGAKVRKGSQIVEQQALFPAPEPLFSATQLNELPTKLNWKPNARAKAYRYELNQGSEDGPRVDTQTLTKPEVELSELVNGTYNVSMSAIDEQGYQGMSTSSSLQVQSSQVVAEPVSPPDKAVIDSLRPELSWQLSDDNASARFDLAQDPDFKHIVYKSEYSNEITQWPEQDMKPGVYFWRVATPDGVASETFSETRKITLRATLDETSIMTVKYQTNSSQKNEVGLFWNPVEHATGYVLQVSDTPDFTEILREETLDKPSAHVRLKPGLFYYARVKGLESELFASDYGPATELHVNATQ